VFCLYVGSNAGILDDMVGGIVKEWTTLFKVEESINIKESIRVIVWDL
jgi:hypothetical protein